MRSRTKKRTNKGTPKWMVTYADMVTLVLVFFILLFSMSQIDVVKFEALAESFRSSMIFDSYPSPVPLEDPAEKESHQEKEAGELEEEQPLTEADDTLSELLTEIRLFLDEHNLNNDITADRTAEGVVLTLQENVLFESAEAEIIDDGKPFLDKVETLLHNFSNPVRVEGHTDSVPISTYRFPSNWELAGARASSVIRYLIENGDLEDDRFIAVGYGDTRPVADNDTSENRRKNRRVEIIILEEQ
ncbi:flagellar motor protein MotS [Sediminibacillus massiliensis]|uniref:flagellar motor protein MotS n=1 Tax=Sediminibacillus massiliensis TaxID=1926277 RepID=UPI0009888357|nr:flagellar motor protein MotS [Sediminibacillus massiliensis]